MAFTKKEKEAGDEFTPERITFQVIEQNTQSHKIVSTDTVVDPDTKKIRKIKLCHGASTIFMDEMKDYELTLPAVDLIFFDRKLEVEAVEVLKIQYLRLTDQNAERPDRMPNKKPGVFKELKPLADVKAKLAQRALANKAEALATECTLEEMLPFAHVLGIDTNQASDYIRDSFIGVASVRPDYFLKYFDNPKNIKQYQISKAIDKGIVFVAGGLAKWKEGDKKIVEVPVNKDPKSFLADYAGTDEGKAFYEAVKKLI